MANNENNTLQSRLLNRLDRDPNGKAIAFYSDGIQVSWISFEDFYRRAAGYANVLSENGLKKGKVCLIVLPSGELALFLTTATLLLGGIPLLIAPPSLQAEGVFSSVEQIIWHTIRKTKPAVVIIPETLSETQRKPTSKQDKPQFIIGNQDFQPAASDYLPRIMPQESDVAAMQLTSGTTGFPRICVWKQKSVIAALDGMYSAMKLSEDDVCLNWTPLYHDMGLVNNFFLCITSGIPLIMLSPTEFVKNPSIWLRALSETAATTTWSPNFGFAITAQRVRDRDLLGVRLDHVRSFWNAAERIHYDTLIAFHKRFEPYGIRFDAIKTNFGCAENIGGATFSEPEGGFHVEHIDPGLFLKRRIAKPIDGQNAEVGRLSIVGVGNPHPGIKVSILSRNGRSLPDGRVGEIALETPSRMEGYLADARATRRALKHNLLLTGDLGFTRNGELFWVGRVRERINLRGVKLDPSDFEPILLQVRGLRHGNFAAFGVDDVHQGTQKLVIVSEVREEIDQKPEDISSEIRNQVFEHLGINVNEVILVRKGTLTKTTSGKRRHRYFHNLYMEGKLEQHIWNPEKVGN